MRRYCWKRGCRSPPSRSTISRVSLNPACSKLIPPGLPTTLMNEYQRRGRNISGDEEVRKQAGERTVT